MEHQKICIAMKERSSWELRKTVGGGGRGEEEKRW